MIETLIQALVVLEFLAGMTAFFAAVFRYFDGNYDDIEASMGRVMLWLLIAILAMLLISLFI